MRGCKHFSELGEFFITEDLLLEFFRELRDLPLLVSLTIFA